MKIHPFGICIIVLFTHIYTINDPLFNFHHALATQMIKGHINTNSGNNSIERSPHINSLVEQFCGNAICLFNKEKLMNKLKTLNIRPALQNPDLTSNNDNNSSYQIRYTLQPSKARENVILKQSTMRLRPADEANMHITNIQDTPMESKIALII
jgi:hypothetical protein